MILSSHEIENIHALLVSPNDQNVLLAISLLRHHPQVVQQLLIPLEIVLLYQQHKEINRAVVQLLQQQPTNIWPQLSLYAFHQLIGELTLKPEHHSTIQQFLKKESLYRPYLLSDNKKVLLYVDAANFISAAPEFVDNAYMFYDLVLMHLPEDSYVYYNYAGLLRKSPPSKLSDAKLQTTIINYYKRAYTIQPEKHILRRLADYYTKDLNQLEAARATWHWCIQEHPDYGAAWISLAQLEIQEKQWDNAQQALEQALTLRDKGIWVEADQIYYLLGMVNWRGWGDFDKAQQYFEQALDENKFFAAPLEALLKLSTSTENYQQAIQYYKLALEMQPMNIFLLIKLAQLYTQTENYDKAIETYKEILDISPHYTPALEGLEQLKRF